MKITKQTLNEVNNKFFDTFDRVDKLYMKNTKKASDSMASNEFYKEFRKLRDLWIWLHRAIDRT